MKYYIEITPQVVVNDTSVTSASVIRPHFGVQTFSASRYEKSLYILLGLGECRGGAGKRLSIGDLAA